MSTTLTLLHPCVGVLGFRSHCLPVVVRHGQSNHLITVPSRFALVHPHKASSSDPFSRSLWRDIYLMFLSWQQGWPYVQLITMLNHSSSAESERRTQDAKLWQARYSEFSSTCSLPLMLRDGKRRPLPKFLAGGPFELYRHGPFTVLRTSFHQMH
jgi:hypothetical protein|uniref:Uncharacterized protein n=1 Tax=Mus musculus TaxID=10090 RepID=Q8BN39_MOUSE|nr:unnamed protein product [Mus musculus]